jgi:hypothetical protein
MDLLRNIWMQYLQQLLAMSMTVFVVLHADIPLHLSPMVPTEHPPPDGGRTWGIMSLPGRPTALAMSRALPSCEAFSFVVIV